MVTRRDDDAWPDAAKGEVPWAWVVTKVGQTTSEDLRAYCRERLAPYKVPAKVEFRADLPKTMVGQVLRRVLVEETRARRGIAGTAWSRPSRGCRNCRVASRGRRLSADARRHAACSRRCRIRAGKARQTGEHDVANLTERVTDLEGHAENHTKAVDGLRMEVAELRADLRTGVAQLRGDTRSDFAELRTEISRRFEVIDAKSDRHFVWLVGMMVTGFITVIGALVGVVYR